MLVGDIMRRVSNSQQQRDSSSGDRHLSLVRISVVRIVVRVGDGGVFFSSV